MSTPPTEIVESEFEDELDKVLEYNSSDIELDDEFFDEIEKLRQEYIQYLENS